MIVKIVNFVNMSIISKKCASVIIKFKGLGINNSLELAHRFMADLVDPIEQNRKRSCATFRILRLRIGQRWSEAGMQKL